MHIAFVTPEFAGTGQVNGGLGNYLVRVTRLLSDRGHQCEVFVCNGEDLPKQTDERFDLDGVLVHALSHHVPESLGIEALPMPSWAKMLFAGAWRLAEVVHQCHEEAPFDLVQVSNCGLPALFVDVFAPVSMRLSSYEPLLHRAYGHPLEVYAAFVQTLERACILQCDSVFAPSKFLAGALCQELKLHVEVVRTPIFQEVPCEAWDIDWVDQVAPQSQCHLVFVGSISRTKGCHVLGEAIPAVLARHPEVHFHFVGREIAIEMEPFFQMVQQHADRVHLHGSQPHARVYPLMARAAALLAPSIMENLPNSVLEASLLGTPVVGSMGTSIDEIIEDGVTGFLVPPGDAGALTQAMMRLLELPEKSRRALGEAARSVAERSFSPERCLDSLLGFYEATLRQPVRHRIPRDRRLATVLADATVLARGAERMVKDARTQLDAILNSRTWRMASRVHRILDRFPRPGG